MNPQNSAPKLNNETAKAMLEEQAQNAQSQQHNQQFTHDLSNENWLNKQGIGRADNAPTSWMYDILFNSISNRKTLLGKVLVSLLWLGSLGILGLIVKLASS